MSSASTTDVVIAGAGLAGSVAAHVLAGRGVRVALVDSRADYPACFKAEKIEAHQAEMFREFRLMDMLLPHTGRIDEVLEAQSGRVLQVLRLEQYGIYYHDMVNELRRRLPAEVDVRYARVQDITCSDDLQEVKLADGSSITARLVVMACGTGGSLSGRLGIERRPIRKEHSIAFGFDVAATGARPFPFQSVTYYPDGAATRIGYLTLFLIRDVMRANLFAFHSLNDEWSREMTRDPRSALLRSLPRLGQLTGDFQVSSKVESARIDLYQVARPARPGLALIGDSFQSVCPTTGTGLSKVLTDVGVLCNDCIPKWLATPGMGAEKIAAFYAHPRKTQVDQRSLQMAEYRRQVSIDGTLRWRIHRAKVQLGMLWKGWPDTVRWSRKLTT